jgi:hypothetical protein
LAIFPSANPAGQQGTSSGLSFGIFFADQTQRNEFEQNPGSARILLDEPSDAPAKVSYLTVTANSVAYQYSDPPLPTVPEPGYGAPAGILALLLAFGGVLGKSRRAAGLSA